MKLLISKQIEQFLHFHTEVSNQYLTAYAKVNECDKLTQDLMELRSGTKMRLVVSEETRCIYEISVNGETWLTFEGAIKKINNNMEFGRCIGYVSLAVGAVFTLTVLVSLLWEGVRKGMQKRANCV